MDSIFRRKSGLFFARLVAPRRLKASSLFTDDLRDKESAKIEFEKAHFEALHVGENPVKYVVARSLGDLMAHQSD